MKQTLKWAGCVLLGLALHGCASYKPVPDGYTGPVAEVADSGSLIDAKTGIAFALMEINGKGIDNSFGASAGASHDQGFTLRARFITRQVPATPMKVRLKGSHLTGAPFHAISRQMAGIFFFVEGVVDFKPEPGGRYFVNGELRKGVSSVWIEDRATGLPVTEKIVEK